MSSHQHRILIDEVNANLTYIGKADPGSATSAEVWQIMKLTPSEVSYAGGTDEFKNIWDDRASYTYS